MGATFTTPLELPAPKTTPGDTNNLKRYLDEYVVRVRRSSISVAQAQARARARARSTLRVLPSDPLHLLSDTVPTATASRRALPRAQYFEESTPFREDLSWGNMKMAIMIVSCAAALVSQFYPLPFPDNRMLLGVCVVIYFVLSGVLQFMVMFLDRDVMYRSLPAPPGEFGAGERAVLRTSLPKGQATYSLTVELPQGVVVWTHAVSIGNYYTSAGTLVPERVRKDIEAIVESVKRKVNRKAAAAGPTTQAAAAGAARQSNNNANPALDATPAS
jgi:hypothetical protein